LNFLVLNKAYNRFLPDAFALAHRDFAAAAIFARAAADIVRFPLVFFPRPGGLPIRLTPFPISVPPRMAKVLCLNFRFCLRYPLLVSMLMLICFSCFAKRGRQ